MLPCQRIRRCNVVQVERVCAWQNRGQNKGFRQRRKKRSYWDANSCVFDNKKYAVAALSRMTVDEFINKPKLVQVHRVGILPEIPKAVEVFLGKGDKIVETSELPSLADFGASLKEFGQRRRDHWRRHLLVTNRNCQSR